MASKAASYVIVVFSALYISAASAGACNVPVYRYALERWPADPFALDICYKGALSPDEKETADFLLKTSLDGDGRYNFTVNLIDLEDESYAPVKNWIQEKNLTPPCVLLRYPLHLQIPGVIDSGPLTEEYVRPLIESPLRKEIATRILQGDTAVWLFLESGDSAKDQKAEEKLNQLLQRFEKELDLPDLSDVTAADTIALDDSASPLQIQFSSMRISRNDPAEKILINMLMRSESDLYEYEDEPMVFPVFGRGRVLYALVGEGITEDNVLESAGFLIGPCSCLVKDLNPGTDLLLPVNWDEGLQELMVQDLSVPLPFGLAEIDSPTPAIGYSIPLSADSPEPSSSNFMRNFIIGITVIVLLNGILLIKVLK